MTDTITLRGKINWVRFPLVLTLQLFLRHTGIITATTSQSDEDKGEFILSLSPDDLALMLLSHEHSDFNATDGKFTLDISKCQEFITFYKSCEFVNVRFRNETERNRHLPDIIEDLNAKIGPVVVTGGRQETVHLKMHESTRALFREKIKHTIAEPAPAVVSPRYETTFKDIVDFIIRSSNEVGTA